jgi:2-methylcitrate dehydratase PrpD
MRRALDEPRLAERWNVATVSGIIAAVGAAARVGGLDVGRARHAFGIAATQAAGTGVTTGTPAGALASGKAASDAVEAVALAGAGFTGPAAPIEGRRGLAALIAERVVDDALVTGLGARWEHSRT